MSKSKRLWILFTTTMSISATTNGGFAIVSMMKRVFVEKYQWLSEEEMLDMISISQSVPGPIAINTSVLVGYHVDGVLGAVVTMLGTAFPPLVIMSIVSLFYQSISDNQYVRFFMKGMQAAVGALLVDVSIDLISNVLKKHEALSIVLAAFSFILIFFFKINILYLVLGCAAIGLIKVCLLKKEVQ